MENSGAVRTAIEEGKCLFGTVDTWIIWVCSGGFRNLERGVQPLENVWVATPTSGHMNAFMTHIIII